MKRKGTAEGRGGSRKRGGPVKFRRIIANWQLYVFLLPALIYFIVFCYGPMLSLIHIYIAPDSRCHAFFHGVDWFPTLLSACRLELPEGVSLDGKNRLDEILLGSSSPSEPYYWQWNRFTPVSKCNAAIRCGKWKLVWPPVEEAMQVPPYVVEIDERIKQEETVPDTLYLFDDSYRRIPAPHPPRLYNLEDDPLERHDVSLSLIHIL